MNIERAIEILIKAKKEPDILYSADFIDALQLGIEALKWRQRFIAALPSAGQKLLPGETEE